MANLEIATTIALLGTSGIFAYIYTKTDADQPLRLGFLAMTLLFCGLSFMFLWTFAGQQSETAIQSMLTYAFYGMVIIFTLVLALWFIQLIINGINLMRPNKEGFDLDAVE
jgi:xanthine/uracil/vitamin C permease (AzgA family)